ncbi:MAG: hypothetical protein MZV70_10935 [Desulfobacterales bacterium]|nr:hypothetical protein [Desulfobacterales bacterium]
MTTGAEQDLTPPPLRMEGGIACSRGCRQGRRPGQPRCTGGSRRVSASTTSTFISAPNSTNVMDNATEFAPPVRRTHARAHG